MLKHKSIFSFVKSHQNMHPILHPHQQWIDFMLLHIFQVSRFGPGSHCPDLSHSSKFAGICPCCFIHVSLWHMFLHSLICNMYVFLVRYLLRVLAHYLTVLFVFKCIFICIVYFSRHLLNNFLIWFSLILYALTQQNHNLNVIIIREIQKIY